MEWLSAINDALVSFATHFEGSPWLFIVLWLFITADGIVPFFPSETLIIGIIALSMTAGTPNKWMVFVVAVTGAICGDLGAYTVGRALGRRDFALLRRPRVARILTWAERAVMRRPATIIISARYIPIGRIAVNFTAGRMVFPFKAFAFFVVIAAAAWSGYSILIGVGAGAWLENNAVLAVAVGVAGGIAAGYVVDKILTRVLSFGHRRGRTFGAGFDQLDSANTTGLATATAADTATAAAAAAITAGGATVAGSAGLGEYSAALAEERDPAESS